MSVDIPEQREARSYNPVADLLGDAAWDGLFATISFGVSFLAASEIQATSTVAERVLAFGMFTVGILSGQGWGRWAAEDVGEAYRAWQSSPR